MVVVMEIKLWVAVGVIAFVMPVLFWIIRWAVDRVVKRLDKLIEQNASMNNELTRHDGEIKTIGKDLKRHECRLDDHGKRIRKLETKDWHE
jgi:type VI protein secretion system component VasK